jgi:hypothetical protein
MIRGSGSFVAGVARFCRARRIPGRFDGRDRRFVSFAFGIRFTCEANPLPMADSGDSPRPVGT